MDWNAIVGAVGGAMEKKYGELEKNMERKARGFSDDELEGRYNQGAPSELGNEILEREMRRRGLL